MSAKRWAAQGSNLAFRLGAGGGRARSATRAPEQRHQPERDHDEIEAPGKRRDALGAVPDRELVRARPRYAPTVGVPVDPQMPGRARIATPRLDSPSIGVRLGGDEQEWPVRASDANSELARRHSPVGESARRSLRRPRRGVSKDSRRLAAEDEGDSVSQPAREQIAHPVIHPSAYAGIPEVVTDPASLNCKSGCSAGSLELGNGVLTDVPRIGLRR